MLINRSAPPATVTPVLVYDDVRAAVAWLESAFAFGERVRIGDGHRAQLRVGSDGAVVVADSGADRAAPSGGGVTHIVKVRVPDVDAAFARAREAGARVVEELRTWEYGERSGVVEDIGGHRWELTQTVRDVAPRNGVGLQSPPGESCVGMASVRKVSQKSTWLLRRSWSDPSLRRSCSRFSCCCRWCLAHLARRSAPVPATDPSS
jgi:uncharacterized glyoxalase superfamily protein PhnB